MTAKYKLLQPHYVMNAYLDAGTTVTEGVQIPVGWTPTINVDPLNSDALTAFYNAGPRVATSWEQSNEFGRENYLLGTTTSSLKPVTYWKFSSNGFYSLTGLGVMLSPVFGG